MSLFKKSVPFYDPEQRYKVTLHIQGNRASCSSNMSNLSAWLQHNVQQKCEWIVMPTNDKTPDLMIRRSEVTLISIEEAKS